MGDAALSASQAVTVVSKPAGAGELFSCAIKLDATVACWGGNDYGQLGDGTTTERTTPVQVSGLSGVVGLGVGQDHACALKRDGSVACWGRNDFGQLGNSNQANHTTPTPVAGLSNVIALTAGADLTCALRNNGLVTCFGAGQFEPNELDHVSDAVALSAGRSHVCALKGDGSVACWGSNSYGQLGDGTLDSHTQYAVAVSGLSNVVALEARERGNCALKADGTVMCWGNNQHGQLGDGSTDNRTIPVAVNGLTGVIALAHGGSTNLNSCALKSDRSVVCWGDNGAGQLGDGSTDERRTPVTVTGLTDATSITIGYGFSCALKADGSMACWGTSDEGRLGNGSDMDSSVPVAVSGGAVFWR